jgi:hypothetical protein
MPESSESTTQARMRQICTSKCGTRDLERRVTSRYRHTRLRPPERSTKSLCSSMILSLKALRRAIPSAWVLKWPGLIRFERLSLRGSIEAMEFSAGAISLNRYRSPPRSDNPICAYGSETPPLALCLSP